MMGSWPIQERGCRVYEIASEEEVRRFKVTIDAGEGISPPQDGWFQDGLSAVDQAMGGGYPDESTVDAVVFRRLMALRDYRRSTPDAPRLLDVVVRIWGHSVEVSGVYHANPAGRTQAYELAERLGEVMDVRRVVVLLGDDRLTLDKTD